MNEEDKVMQATDTLLDRSTTPISIPFIQEGLPSGAEKLHLRIVVGACRLKIVPGEGPEWVTGSYYDPSQTLPLDVTRVGTTVTINQARDIAELLRLCDGSPTLSLAL